MNIEELREYCLNKKGVTEGFPFGEDALVFKVMNKMYALIGINNPELAINLKCDPERAIELREEYEAVKPGYHMNKQHWNTVTTNGLTDEMVYELVDHSYDLIVQSLTKKAKEELANL